MIPDDEPTVQPPDPSEVIDDDIENEKTTTTFDTPNNILPFNENTTTFNENKNEEQSPEIEIITLNDPDLSPNTNITMTQRTIEIETAVVIVNHQITTLVTLQLRPSKGSTHLDVLKAHKNIFSAMKLIDPTLKLITFQNETIDTTDQFPSSALEYTSKFKKLLQRFKNVSSLHIAQNWKCNSTWRSQIRQQTTTIKYIWYSSN